MLFVSTNQFANYIYVFLTPATAFSNTQNDIEAWVEERGKTPSKVLLENSTEAPFSKESSNGIINHIKNIFNPVVKEYDQSAYHGTSHRFDIKPIELQKDVVPNFDKVADLKKWIEDNLNLLGDVQIKSNNRTVRFSKSNVSRSLKGVNRNSVKRNSYAGLKELVENSIYGYTKEADEGHKERNKGQELHHNAFIYNGEVYGIEISIDIPKSENSPNVYAGHKVKVIEMEPSAIGVHQKGTTDGTDSTISINDIRTLFNLDIKVYYQGNDLGNKRAFTHERTNFDGTVKDNLVVLLKGETDKSTLLHEFVHVYLTAF